MPIDRVYLCPSTPLLCPSRVTPYLAMFLLLYRFALSLSLSLFTALRPVTSHNRPVGARVLFQLLLHLLLLLSRTSFSSTSAPLSISESTTRSSIHLLPSPHSFQTFLSLRALTPLPRSRAARSPSLHPPVPLCLLGGRGVR